MRECCTVYAASNKKSLDDEVQLPLFAVVVGCSFHFIFILLHSLSSHLFFYDLRSIWCPIIKSSNRTDDSLRVWTERERTKNNEMAKESPLNEMKWELNKRTFFSFGLVKCFVAFFHFFSHTIVIGAEKKFFFLNRIKCPLKTQCLCIEISSFLLLFSASTSNVWKFISSRFETFDLLEGGKLLLFELTMLTLFMSFWDFCEVSPNFGEPQFRPKIFGSLQFFT